MATNKDLEVQKTHTAMTHGEEIPEFMREQLGNQAGMENVDNDDLLLPRLGLAQSLSPQLRKTDPSYIPDLKVGQLFNTVTKEIYGDELEIIPLFFFKNRIKFNPIDEGGGIDCNSPNAIDMGRISPDGCSICRFSVWGNGAKDDEHGNDAPLCTIYHNYMAFIPATRTPIAISYKSTGVKLSKQILAGIRLTKLPMYAKKQKIQVVEMSANKNFWFEKKLIPGAFVDKVTFDECEKNFNELQKRNIRVDTTGEEAGDASFDSTF